MKGNIHKKATYESKFSRRYACWVRNNRKAWHWYKRNNRRAFRRIMDKECEEMKREDANFGNL